MEDLKSALSTFLSDAAKYFKEDDLKLLLSEDIDDLVSLKCVSRTTLEEIGLADILIDHLLKAQQGIASPPFFCFIKICHAHPHFITVICVLKDSV